MNAFRLCTLIVILSVASATHDERSKVGFASAKRALIIAVDGLGGAYLQQATNISTFESLYNTGSYTLKARCSMPTMSLPNFKTMLSGAGPEETGTYSNEWFPYVADLGSTTILSDCVHQGIINGNCAGCATCITMASALQLLVKGGATPAQVLNYIETSCNLFSGTYQIMCNAWVSASKQGTDPTFQKMVQFLKTAPSDQARFVCIYPFQDFCVDEMLPVAGGNQYPTLFKIIKQARPELTTAVYTDYDGIAAIIEDGTIDTFKFEADTDKNINLFIQMLKTTKPDVAYIHIDAVDHAGHSYGWGSAEYYEAISYVDGRIKDILNALDSIQALDDTFVLVTADHSGSQSHGRPILVQELIPFIAVGPLVQQNHEVTSYTRNMDTSPTILFVLGITKPDYWRGTAAYDIFGAADEPDTPDREVDNVIVIGIASLSPVVFSKTQASELSALLTSSNTAYTLNARTVFPVASSLSSWASVLMGAGPEEHGVITDSWLPPPAKADIPPSTGAESLFPSMFEVASTENRNIKTGAFFGNASIENLLSSDYVDKIESASSDSEAVDSGLAFLQDNTNKANLLFFELEGIESAAYQYGYFSTQYYSAVQTVDALVGKIVKKVRDLGLEDKTTIIITSNRGRLYNIGEECRDSTCVNVPFIIHGPNLIATGLLSTNMSLIDVAPIAVNSLGLPTHQAWTGRSVIVQKNVQPSSKSKGQKDDALFYGMLSLGILVAVGLVMVILAVLHRKGIIFKKSQDVSYHKMPSVEMDEKMLD